MNLVEQGFDVAILFGEIPDSRLTARTIAFNRRLLCAAPQYLQEFGAPMRPSDLRSHQCIVLRESDETYGTWHLAQASRTETVKVRGRISTNDGERSEEHTSELQSLMRSSYAVFCLKKKNLE